MEKRLFSFLKEDINDLPACLAAVKAGAAGTPINTVWHLAANSDIRAGVSDPDVDLRLTVLTTYNTLKLMAALDIPQLVFASTSAIYGENPGPLEETTGPLFPVSNYGAMKLASEGIITAALERFLKRVWICRFPNVVGSRSTHGVIVDLLRKLRVDPTRLEVLGDGTQEKPYLHVAELVDALLFIFQKSGERLNCFNIAPESGGTTVRYIAEAVRRAAAPKATLHYTGGSRGWVGDVPKFTYSTARLKKLGWSAKLTSDAAVDRAVTENL